MNTGIGKIKRANDGGHLPIFMQVYNKLISGTPGKHAKQAATGLRVKQGFNMGVNLRARISSQPACVNLHGGAVLIMQA